MKKINHYLTITIITFSLFSSSCTKSFDSKNQTIDNLSNLSKLQVFIGTVGASRNYIYVDGKPVNGAGLSTSNIFPSVGTGVIVTPGFRALLIRDTSSTATQVPLSFSHVMQAGNSYTTFTYDTITSAKQKTVLTNLVVPSDNSCRIRFANLAYNGTALTPAIDIVSIGKNEIVMTDLKYAEVTDFIAHAPGLANEAFEVRLSGTSTALSRFTFSSSTTPSALVGKRSYTIVYRGSHRSSTGRGITIIADN